MSLRNDVIPKGYSFSSNSDLFKLQCGNGLIRVWDLQSENIIWSHKFDAFVETRFYGTTPEILSVSGKGTITGWDIYRNKTTLKIETGRSGVEVIPDSANELVYTADRYGLLTLWSKRGGRKLAEIQGEATYIYPSSPPDAPYFVPTVNISDSRAIVLQGSNPTLYELGFEDLLKKAESLLPLTLHKQDRLNYLSR